MRALADALLFLAWVTAFLALALRIAEYRRARVGAISGREAYRPDADIPFRIAMPVVAAALGVCVYLLSRLVSSLL
jgi:hypothetical protein